MRIVGKILIATGTLGLLWSLYIFVKYIGLGGDNRYTPYTGVGALIVMLVGFMLLKRR